MSAFPIRHNNLSCSSIHSSPPLLSRSAIATRVLPTRNPAMASQSGAVDSEKGPDVSLTVDEQPTSHALRPKCFTSTLQECLFVLTATMAIGQQSFFQGCVVGVTASIGADLKMNSAEITWINAGASYVPFQCSSYLDLSPISKHKNLTTTQQPQQRRIPPNVRQTRRHVRPQSPLHHRHGRLHPLPARHRLRHKRNLHGRLLRHPGPLRRGSSPTRCRRTGRCLRKAVETEESRLCVLQRGESARFRWGYDYLWYCVE